MTKTPLITESLICLNICGLNPLKQRWCSKVKQILFLALTVHFIIELTLEFVLNWRGWKSVNDFLMYFGIYQVISKLIILIVQSRECKELLDRITSRFLSIAEEKVDDTFQSVKNFLIFYGTSGIIAITGYSLLPMVSSVKRLPFHTYHPTNYTIAYTYDLMYVIQTINLVVAFLVIYGFDMLFVSFATYIVCELKILKYNILHLNLNKDFQQLKEVKDVIDHHNLILRCIQELNEIYSVPLLNQFLSSLFCICIGLLSIIASGFPPTLENVFLSSTYLILCLSQIFIYCVSGAYITTECKNISDAVYETNWWIRTQSQLRRAFVLIIERGQKQEALTAGGMFTLNLESFTKVVRTSLSFFMVAQALFAVSNKK